MLQCMQLYYSDLIITFLKIIYETLNPYKSVLDSGLEIDIKIDFKYR